MKFWRFFLDNESFTWLVVIIIIGLGGLSLARIPKESAPEVQIPVAIITTVFPGASPIDVERLVTKKIEDQLKNGLDNVDTITSSSNDSVSVISVQFLASANIKDSIAQVKDEVDKVKTDLPSDANDPTITDVNFADQPIMYVSVSSDLPSIELISLSEKIKDELKSVSDVSKVTISGIETREAQVIVNKEALATYGVSLLDVVQAISQANSSIPVGSIEQNGVQYAVKFQGELQNPNDIGSVTLQGPGGRLINLRDLALISNGVSATQNFSRVSVQGAKSERAMSFAIYKRRGGDVTALSSGIKDKLAELQKTDLAHSKVLVTFDAGEQAKKDLSELSRVGIEAVALVMILLFLTIGWREAVIAGLSIPLSILLTFVGLDLSGNTINFVSLFALILAVGILVDTAIVVTEAIHTRIARGLTRKQAARETLREFHLPLTAGIGTTVAVFVPLFTISGVTGKFIAVIPFTIITILIASLFVSLGITPLMAMRFLSKERGGNITQWQENYTHRFQTWYRNLLQSILGNKKRERTFIWTLVSLFFVSFLLPISGALGVIFFPQENSEYVIVDIEKPVGTVLGETDLSVREVEEFLYGDKNIDSFTSTVGATSQFSGNPQSGERYGSVFILLTDKDNRPASTVIVEDLRHRLSSIHSAKISVSEPNNGPPSGAPIVIKFFGDDLDALGKATSNAEKILSSIPGTANVRSSSNDDSSEFVLHVDRAKAAQLGLTPVYIAQTLRTAVYGVKATTIKNAAGDTDVMVKLNMNPDYRDTHDTARINVNAISSLRIDTPNGPVLLGSVLTPSLERGINSISHEEGERVESVSSDLLSGATSQDILSQFTKRTSELNLPDGVRLSLGGENEDVNKSFQDMFVALIMGMLLILGILVLEFNSYRHAFSLIAIIPLTLIGVLFGLTLTGKTVSFPSMLGFIALAGVVVNHAIILLDVMKHVRLAHPKMSVRDAVIEGAITRLRPVMLTTITTVIGVIPLTRVSELWAPLAYSVMFGLSFSVIVTLLLLPILYLRKPGDLSEEE